MAPTSAAYALLTNAANQIVTDAHASIPKATTLVIYDQATFGNMAYYPSALGQLKSSMGHICDAITPPAPGTVTNFSVSVDAGSSASALASLIGLTLPAYAIQGQAVTIDNTALIASVEAVAQAAPYSMNVINPAYLLPATQQSPLDCKSKNYLKSSSVADLWAALADQAGILRAKRGSDTDAASKAALAEYQKILDTYLAADKGLPLLSKLLLVESLVFSVDPSTVAVIDMRLDGVGIDSTSRTILWWRSTKFSSNVLAHYAILSVRRSDDKMSLTLVKPGYVNFMLKDVNQKGLRSSVQPLGNINPHEE